MSGECLQEWLLLVSGSYVLNAWHCIVNEAIAVRICAKMKEEGRVRGVTSECFYKASWVVHCDIVIIKQPITIAYRLQ